MKIKIPVRELDRDNVYSRVEETLEKDPENAYTIAGIMIQTFKINPKDIENKPFSAWKRGQPTLYGRIDRCLRRLVKEGKAQVRKHEKAMVYWWIKQPRGSNFELRG